MIGARLFLSERLTLRRALGVGSGLAGLAVLFSPGSLDWSNQQELLGVGLVMVGAVFWAANIVYVRAHTWISSPFQLVFWQLLLATALLTIMAIAFEGRPKVVWTPRLALLLAFIGVVCTALPQWAITVVTRSLPAVTTSLGLLATPALGIAVGIVLLGEAFDPSLIMALVLLLGGIAFGVVGDGKPNTTEPGACRPRL